MSEHNKEKEALNALTNAFERVSGIVQREKRVIVKTDAETIPGVLLYAKERLKYNHSYPYKNYHIHQVKIK